MTNEAIFWGLGVAAGVLANYIGAPWQLVLAVTGMGMIFIAAMGE